MNDEDFDRYFTVLTNAGSRTRSILYLGAIVIATLILPWAQFNLHDWANKRLHMISVARNCANDRKPSDTKLKPDESSWNLETCGNAYQYVSDWYHIPLYGRDISKERPRDEDDPFDDLRQRYDELLKAAIAGQSMTVPVVGTVIDNGSNWLISDFGGVIFLSLLGLSLNNERRCIQHIRPLVTRKVLAQMIIDGNVFSRPSNKRTLGLPLFWLLLLIPMCFALLSFSDLYYGDNYVRTLLDIDGIVRVYHYELMGLVFLFMSTAYGFWSAWRFDRELQKLSDIEFQ